MSKMVSGDLHVWHVTYSPAAVMIWPHTITRTDVAAQHVLNHLLLEAALDDQRVAAVHRAPARVITLPMHAHARGAKLSKQKVLQVVGFPVQPANDITPHT